MPGVLGLMCYLCMYAYKGKGPGSRAAERVYVCASVCVCVRACMRVCVYINANTISMPKRGLPFPLEYGSSNSDFRPKDVLI